MRGRPLQLLQVPHHGGRQRLRPSPRVRRAPHQRRRRGARRSARATRSSSSPTTTRVTRVGRFLRRYSLDELPQLLQRAQGRHERRRAATGSRLRGRGLRRLAPPAAHGDARHLGGLAGRRAQPRLLRRDGVPGRHVRLQSVAARPTSASACARSPWSCRAEVRSEEEEGEHVSSESIAVGLVGYGYWGPNLLRNYMELPRRRVSSGSATRARSSSSKAKTPLPGRCAAPPTTTEVLADDRGRRGAHRHADLDALPARQGGARGRQARLRREADDRPAAARPRELVRARRRPRPHAHGRPHLRLQPAGAQGQGDHRLRRARRHLLRHHVAA